MLQDTLRVSMSIAIAQTLFRAKRVLSIIQIMWS